MIQPNVVKVDNVAKVLDRALDEGGGLLRLTPTWVPRSFLHPGKRIKLIPDDLYAYGANRGGIDERWFASTTEAANEGRVLARRAELLSRSKAKQFLLRDAVAEAGARLIGKAMFEQVQPLAGLLEVLRQHGADPAPHAPELRATPSSSARKASPRATTSRRSTTTSTTTSPTRSWASSRARRRPRSASASRTGTRATTASSICRRPTA